MCEWDVKQILGLMAHTCPRLSLPLNPQSAKKKVHLKMSSAEVVCCKELPNIADELDLEANSMDSEQTAPIGAV